MHVHFGPALRNNERTAMTFATEYLIDLIKKNRKRQLGECANLANITESSINQGYCYHWAMLVHLIADPGRVTLCSTTDHGWHAFIRIGALYYDSNYPHGVLNWRELNPNCWDHKPNDFIVEQSKEDFIKTWPSIRHEQSTWEIIASCFKKETPIKIRSVVNLEAQS